MKRVGSIGQVSLLFCFAISSTSGTPVQASTPYPDFLRDLNQDGVINSQDLLILLQGWGIQGIVTPTPSPTLSSTPTPTDTQRPPPTETFTTTPSPSQTETSTPSSTHTPTSTETPTSSETQTFTPTETVTPTPSPTETATNPNSINVQLPAFIKMVRIPAGSFLMGSTETERSRQPNEGPVHEVTIDYDFYLGETEVTQSQWAAVMGYNAATHSPEGTPWPTNYGVGPNYPVYNVSWDDCQAYLAAFNALGQGNFRLPSEAEWEYACRATTTTRFYFGDSLGCADFCENCLGVKGPTLLPLRSAFMWYCGNSVSSSHPVRQGIANSFGLYDMAGNMWEWCQDWHQATYSGAPIDGSAWESPVGNSRVLRGGAWGTSALNCRSAYRFSNAPGTRSIGLGLRIARSAAP